MKARKLYNNDVGYGSFNAALTVRSPSAAIGASSRPDTNLLEQLKATGEAISAAARAIRPEEADAA